MQTTLQRAQSRQSCGFVPFRAWPQLRYRSPQLRTANRQSRTPATICSIYWRRNHHSTILNSSKCNETVGSHNGGPVRPIRTITRHHPNSSMRIGSMRQLSTTQQSLGKSSAADQVGAEFSTADPTVALDDLELWTQLFRSLRTSHGDEGVWAFFELLREKHRIHLLLKDTSLELRTAIVTVAVAQDQRIQTLLGVATRLRAFQQEWPDLYGTAMSALLRKSKYARAIDCHHRLNEALHPGPDAVAALLSNFIFDPAEDLQSCLRTIYSFNPWRNLYDRIVPLLFDGGCSRLARDWRGLLLRSQDRGASQTCRPFLKHLADFYPSVSLTEEETAVLKDRPATPTSTQQTISENKKSIRGAFRDEFVAKTFASHWLSLDFAINSVQRLGLVEVGPRAIQALALREGNAERVTARVSQLEKLGLGISTQVYCKALVVFARSGEDKLLQQLLTCDVHPDEFDNASARSRMMKQPDLKALMQAVDWALENQTSRTHLNRLLQDVLGSRHLGKAILIISRMDALKISISQRNADVILHRVLHRLRSHARRSKQDITTAGEKPDRFISVLRKLLHHEVGISVAHWRYAFYMLGRLGRFDEWLQLALELVRRYAPERNCLVPMHPGDRPTGLKPKTKTKKSSSTIPNWDEDMEETRFANGLGDFASVTERLAEREGTAKAEETDWIPSDLALSHRQHPLNKIFDSKLQRAVVRWGFDQALRDWPTVKLADSINPRDYDMALGVRILRVLHDNGVLVNKDVIRSAVVRRSVMAQLSGRRHRARDSRETELYNIKRRVDAAWGAELLETLDDFEASVADQRARFWKQGRHSVQFKKDYAGLQVTTSKPSQFKGMDADLLEDDQDLAEAADGSYELYYHKPSRT